MNTWFSLHWLKLLAAVMLLGALGSFPYAYYQFMNWVGGGAAIVTSLQSHKTDRTFFMWLFLLIAVIFNPLAPFYLRSDVWQIADITAALLFLIAAFTINVPKRSK